MLGVAMERATVEEIARAPVGRYVVGETFAHYCAAPRLWGIVLWGRPTIEHAIALGRSLVLELAAPAIPHASLVDASRLDTGDPAAFGALERYLARHGDALRDWVTRLALVRPKGLGGAIVAGAYDVLPRPYPVEVFDAIAPAAAWVADEAEIDSDRIAAILREIHDGATGGGPVVAALRGWLGAHLAEPSIAVAATALGLIEPTHQRKLQDADTTFQQQVAEARVRAATRLLLDSDAPLTAIAYDVGCASLQHFSALFRKHMHVSRSDYRRTHKPG